MLHLAASRTEAEVAAALAVLVEQHLPPVFDAVRDLIQPPSPIPVPVVSTPVLDFGVHDRLLAAHAGASAVGGGERHG